MRKTISIIVIIAIIAVGAYLYVNGTSGEDTNEHQADNQAENPTHKKGEKEEPQDVLEDVFQLAEDGKILGNDMIVGETNLDDIYEKWGETDDKTDVEGVTYLEYSEQLITVGIKDDIVVDVRSSQENIKNINLDVIKDYKGEPNAERKFRDEDHNQTILVYTLSNGYELKWILPQPTNENSNPNVHHIALTKTDDTETAESDDATDSDQSADKLKDMNVDEKIGQLIFSGVNGTEITDDTEEMISNYHIGGIILFGDNIESASQTTQFLNDIKAANISNPYPLLLGVDEEGGEVTRMPDDVTSLPTNKAIGKLEDSDFSYKVGTLLGKQMNELGFNLDFSPVMDVNSNPDNPVIGNRSFGDNSEIVSKLGIQTMKGIQSQHIISVMKHFPGHGDTGVDSHLELPTVDKSYEELTELELIPFQNALENGADVTMIAHILMSEIDSDYPASMSKTVITDILRKKLNFDGVVITDDLTMQAITNHYDIGEAALQSVQAGSDLMLVAHEYDNVANVFNTLKEAVESGELSEKRIDESVKRIQALKEKYDVSDEATEQPNFKKINKKVEDVLKKVR